MNIVDEAMTGTHVHWQYLVQANAMASPKRSSFCYPYEYFSPRYTQDALVLPTRSFGHHSNLPIPAPAAAAAAAV